MMRNSHWYCEINVKTNININSDKKDMKIFWKRIKLYN